MNRRHKYEDSPFDATDETPEETAASLYGLREGRKPLGGANPNRIQRIALTDIHRNPAQPRPAIPPAVLALCAADTPLVDILGKWYTLAFGVGARSLRDYVGGVEPVEALDPDDALGAALVKVIALANSIRANGLTNPITVARREDGGYLIETGERRFQAFTLLHDAIPHDDFARIPARVMTEYDVWRQANENNQRDDLTAIGKARQLAILLMDMWKDEHDFESYLDVVQRDGNDYAYFAQAKDLNSRRGRGETLLEGMGVRSSGSIRQYKRLLMLTPEEWLEAQYSGASLNQLSAIIDEREDTNYSRTNADNAPPEPEANDSYPYHDKDNESGDNAPWHDPDTNRTPLDRLDDTPHDGRSGITREVVPAQSTPPPFANSTPPARRDLRAGMRVRTPLGHEFTLIGTHFNGNVLKAKTDDNEEVSLSYNDIAEVIAMPDEGTRTEVADGVHASETPAPRYQPDHVEQQACKAVAWMAAHMGMGELSADVQALYHGRVPRRLYAAVEDDLEIELRAAMLSMLRTVQELNHTVREVGGEYDD